MNDFNRERSVSVRNGITLPRVSRLTRAKAISDVIAEEALTSERLGRLTDKVAAALLDASLFSVLVPEADGGLGGTGVELFEATEEIARADGSAGWWPSATPSAASSTRCRRQGPQGGVRQRPGRSLDDIAAQGHFDRREGGGFRVSGNFAWGSSSSLSRRVLVPARLEDRDGQQWFRAHLLPAEDAEIKEGSWDVMGLCGTASIDYSISDSSNAVSRGSRLLPAALTFERLPN